MAKRNPTLSSFRRAALGALALAPIVPSIAYAATKLCAVACRRRKRRPIPGAPRPTQPMKSLGPAGTAVPGLLSRATVTR